MTSALWSAAAATTYALPAPPARTPLQGGLFREFIQICADHAGDAAAPLNAVSQQGWHPIPQQTLQAKVPPITLPGFKTDWYHAYTNAEPGRSVVLFAGRGQMFSRTDLIPVPASFCIVVQKPLDQQSLRRAAAWTNAPRFVGNDAGSAYLFRETANVRQAVPPAQFYKVFREGDGRELVEISHPSENASGVAILASISAK